MTLYESIYQPELATICSIKDLTPTEKLFEIEFNSKRHLGHMPGQFVEVSVFGVGEAPISVSSSPTDKSGRFELGIRRVGNVTNALHRMKSGDVIGIRGPFGTHFPCEEMKGRDLLFVAGGLGIVPLRSLLKYVCDKRSDYRRVITLLGSKTPSEQIFSEDFAAWHENCTIEILETVDKGDKNWKGHIGVITTLFPKIEITPEVTTTIIVGPPIMYRFVIKECKDKGISDENIYVSLERLMKCGVGKCGHCQIEGAYVCQEGPVFRYSDIVKRNLKEAI